MPDRSGTSLRGVAVVGAMAVAASLVLGACGDAPSTGQSTPPRSVQPTRPTQQPAPTSAGGTPTYPVPEVTAVAGQRERRVPWRLVERGPDRSVLVEVQAGGPPCDVVTGLDVDEAATAVRLTVWAGRQPGAKCVGQPALLGTFRLRVPLTEPLGSRSLTPGS